MSIFSPRALLENCWCAAGAAVIVAGALLVGCTGQEPTTPQTPATHPLIDAPVKPAAEVSPAQAPCRWVEVGEADGHEWPADLEGAAGRVERKSCGAPEGDTTGMGGPVEWRVVPTTDGQHR